MTAPAPTARTTPTGTMLKNGYQTKITFAADADVDFWEIEVTPGGYEIGDKIDQTTQFNTDRKTAAPPALYDTEDGSILVAYDPAAMSQIIALQGTHTTITVHYPDGSSEADFGWLRSFKEGALVINGRPTATVAFSYAGQDSAGNEEAPVYTAPA